MQHFDPSRARVLPLDISMPDGGMPIVGGIRRRPEIGRLIDVVIVGLLAVLLVDSIGVGG